MPGYMNNDGSELVGGQLPGGLGQSFKLDAGGNLLTSPGLFNGTSVDRWRSLVQGVGLVGGGFAEQGGLSAGALNADLVPVTDVSGHKWFSLQTGGTWSGTITIQCSNDGVTFFSVNVYQ